MTTDVDHLAELDDPNDPDSDYGRGYQAALDAVLAALREYDRDWDSAGARDVAAFLAERFGADQPPTTQETP